MGYRQQFFVIAKVNGKYRTLAICHHQWIFGRTSLRQTLFTLNILRAVSNQPGIRRELAEAATATSNLPMTFPIIGTALVIGTSLHEEGLYSANVRPQLLTDTYKAHPNDDGIVVFDITDPLKPCYGFVFLGTGLSHAQYEKRFRRMIVMNAKTYIAGYYNDSELDELRVRDILQQFNDFTVVDAATLNALWDGSAFKDRSASTAAASNTTSLETDLGEMSLNTPTLKEMVKAAFEEADFDVSTTVKDDLEEEFFRLVLTSLQETPELLRHPGGFCLLEQAVRGSLTVDLTSHNDLTAVEIVEIIHATGTKTGSLTVWLPTTSNINEVAIESIVKTGRIKTLHLGRTPSYKLSDLLLGLRKWLAPEAITTPLLYIRPFSLTYGPPNMIEAQLRVTDKFPHGDGTKFPLLQILYLTRPVTKMTSRDPDGGLEWGKLVDVHPPSKYVAIPLSDALLSLSRIIDLIPAAIARLATAHEEELESLPVSRIVLGIVKKAAIDDTSLAVSPLPGLAYVGFSNSHLGSQVRCPVIKRPVAGKWTLLVIHERPKSSKRPAAMRFAFISEKTLPEYTVLDPATFISRFGGDDDTAAADLQVRWNTGMESVRATMTSLTKAPESEAQQVQMMMAPVARLRGVTDLTEPYVCDEVAAFGTCGQREVVSAINAMMALSVKPFNPAPPGMPQGTSCVQN